ncbi:MAG: GMC family oxidoreductase N-terminal domain-containing protein, partial [Burkholderiaceae bacterium]
MNLDPADFSECYDALIVGGGSTGAVIAARLSEDPHRRVLLLEAGPDKPVFEAMIRAMNNANQVAVVPGLNWKIATSIKGMSLSSGEPTTVHSAASTFDYEAGKVLGGSSAINAVQALRGAPADFDEWADECGTEWSWQNVLPYFRILED